MPNVHSELRSFCQCHNCYFSRIACRDCPGVLLLLIISHCQTVVYDEQLFTTTTATTPPPTPPAATAVQHDDWPARIIKHKFPIGLGDNVATITNLQVAITRCFLLLSNRKLLVCRCTKQSVALPTHHQFTVYSNQQASTSNHQLVVILTSIPHWLSLVHSCLGLYSHCSDLVRFTWL